MKKKLLLLCISLLLVCFIGEIICRVKGIYLSYNERIGIGGYTSPFQTYDRGWTNSYSPYQKCLMERVEFTDSWTANKDGLKEIDIKEIKTGKRVLVVGDSFTEGVGAPPDSSYPRILESVFRKNGDSSVQVINAGLAGSDVFFEYKLLLELLPKYKPDIIILTLNSSDIFEYITRGGFERFKKNGVVTYRQAPWFEPFYAHSLLFRMLIHDIFNYDYSFIKQGDYEREIEKAQNNLSSAIDSFQITCNANHLRFGVIFHPLYPDFQHPELYKMTPLIAHCNEKNISFINAFDCLYANNINEKNWQTIYWPVDGHFKSKGYNYLAMYGYEFLKRQNLLSISMIDSLNNKTDFDENN